MKLADAIRAVTDRERQQLKGHPDPDELLAYHSRRLSPDEGDRIREHLGLCRDCSEMVLALASEAGAQAPIPHISDDQIAQQLSELQARLEVVTPSLSAHRESSAAVKPAARVQAHRMGLFRRPDFAYAIVAGLLAALGVSFWWNYQLSRPWVDPLLADLTQSKTQRAGTRIEEITVSPETAQLVLIFNLEDIHDYSLYRIVISDLDGKEVWSGERKTGRTRSSFSLGLRRGGLSAGEYVFRIYGLRGGQPDEIFSERRRIIYQVE